MGDTWGGSWGSSWGLSWTKSSAPPVVVTPTGPGGIDLRHPHPSWVYPDWDKDEPAKKAAKRRKELNAIEEKIAKAERIKREIEKQETASRLEENRLQQLAMREAAIAKRIMQLLEEEAALRRLMEEEELIAYLFLLMP